MNYPIKKNKLIALQLILLIIGIEKRDCPLQNKKLRKYPLINKKLVRLARTQKKSKPN